MITTTTWSTPHHRLRRSLSSRRSLLVSAFPNSRQSPRLIFARNPASVARRCNRRGLAKPGHRGNIQGDGWRLRRSGHANFPCHVSPFTSPAFQFKSNFLLRHTQVLCYFPCTPRATALRQARVSGGNLQNCAPSAACGGAMPEESNVSLVPSSPYLPKKA